jgi:hypothetical protein
LLVELASGQTWQLGPEIDHPGHHVVGQFPRVRYGLFDSEL